MDREIADHADKPVAVSFPMKDLAGVERNPQIKVWRGNFYEMLHKIRL